MSPSVNPVKPREAARSRSRADAARNHDAVVNAARRVFAQRGLGVSMVEVARAAGVGVGTVYRCFPTKEALHLAVIEHGFDGLSDEAAAALADPDPGAAFFGFLRHAATVMARDRAIVGMARGGFAGSARPASVARLFDLTDELLAGRRPRARYAPASPRRTSPRCSPASATPRTRAATRHPRGSSAIWRCFPPACGRTEPRRKRG